MAEANIGKLSLVLSADSRDLEKSFAKVEVSASAFARKITSPFSKATAVTSGLSGVVGGSLQAGLGAVSKFVDILPGGGLLSGLIDPAKFQESLGRTAENMKALGNESKKLGLDPQFLVGLRHLAGPDADAADHGLKIFLRHLGELKSGSSAAALAFDKAGLGAEKFKSLTNRDAIIAYANAYKAVGDQTRQLAMGFELMGKGAAEAHNVFAQGGDVLVGYEKHVKELGIGTAGQIAAANVYKAIQKDFKLRRDALEARAFERYESAVGIGFAQFRAGDVRKGLENMMAGFGAFLTGNTFAPDEYYKAMTKFLQEQKSGKGPLSEDVIKFQGSLDDIHESASVANATFGMIGSQVTQYKLALAAASYAGTDFSEKLREIDQEMRGLEAKQLAQSLQTPLEKGLAGQADLLARAKIGELTDENLGRGLLRNALDLIHVSGVDKAGLSPKALVRGSAEERSFNIRADREDMLNQRSVVDLLREAVQKLRDMDTNNDRRGRELVEALKDQPDPNVVNF